MNYAIFLSGGSGTRTGSEIPKQYIKAGGHTMAMHALIPLMESDHIDKIIVVAEEEWRESIISEAAEMYTTTPFYDKISGFADPGANRQLSIFSGLKKIMAMEESLASDNMVGVALDTSTVLIHDAARPFLSAELLNHCYDALSGHDGVMPVLPVKDTLYYSEDGNSVGSLLDRGKLYAGQAPELFVLDKYYEANLNLLPERILAINGSTEPAILTGMDIVMIPGDESNFKVTTGKDLEKFIELKEREND
ncbi:MAG: 2-C-methyl-D-erythritol 4-phosphate cytidylyltransferase [Lachnospiraceae bacterium]|nr:2-C-methyl-D-erythritol 4-phosphate cytidylyltransferase [Lachnospiraceae bacterium]